MIASNIQDNIKFWVKEWTQLRPMAANPEDINMNTEMYNIF